MSASETQILHLSKEEIQLNRYSANFLTLPAACLNLISRWACEWEESSDSLILGVFQKLLTRGVEGTINDNCGDCWWDMDVCFLASHLESVYIINTKKNTFSPVTGASRQDSMRLTRLHTISKAGSVTSEALFFKSYTISYTIQRISPPTKVKCMICCKLLLPIASENLTTEKS